MALSQRFELSENFAPGEPPQTPVCCPQASHWAQNLGN